MVVVVALAVVAVQYSFVQFCRNQDCTSSDNQSNAVECSPDRSEVLVLLVLCWTPDYS